MNTWSEYWPSWVERFRETIADYPSNELVVSEKMSEFENVLLVHVRTNGFTVEMQDDVNQVLMETVAAATTAKIAFEIVNRLASETAKQYLLELLDNDLPNLLGQEQKVKEFQQELFKAAQDHQN